MNGGGARSLTAQYATTDQFLTRVETHRLYSEADGTFVEWVLDVLDAAPGDVVLDAGCGPGVYHSELAERGVRVVGVDVFDGMVREARERASHDGRGVGLAQASVEALPFGAGTFDHVMCNHMLYHVPDQAAVLLEIRRVVWPGGRVVLSTNAADNMDVLDALHRRACADLGLAPLVETEPLRFTFEPGSVELVRSVFPEADVRMREDALVFPDADSVLRFYASFLVEQVEEPRPDDYAERLLGRMRELVGAEIEREGRLRVPKRAGCYVADIAG
jgi:2-polyprenyl-3-methyl-5-hydroxy-6-metoxy-1,4-benzoquinol methylase